MAPVPRWLQTGLGLGRILMTRHQCQCHGSCGWCYGWAEPSPQVSATDGAMAGAEPPPLAPMLGLAATAYTTGQRLISTSFLTNTYQLFEDPVLDYMISWGEDGSKFVVWRPTEFARDCSPSTSKTKTSLGSCESSTPNYLRSMGFVG
ncbi:heat shock factor B2c [Hordeum vulgare]|nr:heat shock factor B2c [Hordeum vulgare]